MNGAGFMISASCAAISSPPPGSASVGIRRHRGAHPRTVLQVIVGIDVDDLIERTELGVPEAPQFGVLFPRREPLGIALFEFGHGPGTQGIGTDFVDHRLPPSDRGLRDDMPANFAGRSALFDGVPKVHLVHGARAIEYNPEIFF